MDDAAPTEEEFSFLEEVKKDILIEAPSDAYHQPKEGDVVTVEVDIGDVHETRTWTMGTGVKTLLAGVDINRCVRTMRPGERSSFTSKVNQACEGGMLELLALERCDDLLGDGRLLRMTLQEGRGWQTPQAGTELQVRYCWRFVDAAFAGMATKSSCSSVETRKTSSCEAAAISSKFEIVVGSFSKLAEMAPSREFADFRRWLLHQFNATVTTTASDTPDEVPKGSLCILHNGNKLTARDGKTSFGDATEALQELKAAMDSQSVQEPKEALIEIREDSCRCTAENWLTSDAALRVLSDMRSGQRCLVRVDPSFSLVQSELVCMVEYDIELLKITTLDDVSLDKSRRVIKKITREGEAYERPEEGSTVTFRLEVRSDGGSVKLTEREVTCEAASGRFCSAVEETLLTMKKTERCEVRCSDPDACREQELGFELGSDDVLTISLELLDFSTLETFSAEEAKRVSYGSSRKEVGTQFFQRGEWLRALRRYQLVTANLMYIDHWKDTTSRSSAISLRKACYLNMAACWLKLEAWSEADDACQEVLKDDSENVKALFRRAQALQGLSECREAEKCLRKVLDLDKNNKEATRLLLKLRQLVKSESDQQKEMMSRMARGIGNSQEPTKCPEIEIPTFESRAASGPSEMTFSAQIGDKPSEMTFSAQIGNKRPIVVTPHAEEEDDDTDDIIWVVGITAVMVALASAAYFTRQYWQRPSFKNL